MGQRREWPGRESELRFSLSPFLSHIAANDELRLVTCARSLRHRINPKFDPDQTFTAAVSGPLK
jgi:hypothetical protein